MVKGLPPEADQIAELRKLQRDLWDKHQVSTAIVIRLGDVPMLTAYGNAEIAGVSGYDLWVSGNLERPNLSADQAVTVLRESCPLDA